jgi:riboflavin transporter FmnP
MTKDKTLFYKSALYYGLMLGLVLILFDIILWSTHLKESTIIHNLSLIIIIAGIVIGIKKYRDKINNGIISYSKALGLGTLIIFITSVVLAIYYYLFYTVIDTEAISKIIELSEEKMIETGLDDEQIDITLEMTKKFTTPFMLSIGTIFSVTFWGFIFSLIISLFLKKENNPFKNDNIQVID